MSGESGCFSLLFQAHAGPPPPAKSNLNASPCAHHINSTKHATTRHIELRDFRQGLDRVKPTVSAESLRAFENYVA